MSFAETRGLVNKIKNMEGNLSGWPKEHQTHTWAKAPGLDDAGVPLPRTKPTKKNPGGTNLKAQHIETLKASLAAAENELAAVENKVLAKEKAPAND